MNSLGNSSKWPSYDSLSSTSSHLLSESEQTEDEADVFSEGEGDSCIRKSLAGDNGITLFPALSDQLHSRSKGNGPERCPAETKRPDQASSHGAAALGSSSATPGDRTFAQKVSTLKLIPRSSFRHCRQPNIRSSMRDTREPRVSQYSNPSRKPITFTKCPWPCIPLNIHTYSRNSAII